MPEHVTVNRAHWDEQAQQWIAPAERNWEAAEPDWGIWATPESTLRLLPADMTGLDAIELGCGTAYVAAWMARRGARVVGIDNSERQLDTARRLAREHGVELTLVHGNAETVPYGDESFDFAISEYGAAIWCDPNVWIPEAHRLLRQGGSLVFLGNTPLTLMCTPLDGSAPCTERLERDYFSLHRLDWRDAVDDPGGIEFNLPISRGSGCSVRPASRCRLHRDPGAGTGVGGQLLRDRRLGPPLPSEQVWKLASGRSEPATPVLSGR